MWTASGSNHPDAAISEQRPDSGYMTCDTSASHSVTFRKSSLQPHHFLPYLTWNEKFKNRQVMSIFTYYLSGVPLLPTHCYVWKITVRPDKIQWQKHTTNLAGFLWTSDQLVAETSTWQHTTTKTTWSSRIRASWYNYEYNQRDATIWVYLLFLVSSTCFWWCFRPSSETLDCTRWA